MNSRIKHKDIRYHFIREYVGGRLVVIVFPCLIENDTDIFAKNVGKATHQDEFIQKNNYYQPIEQFFRCIWSVQIVQNVKMVYSNIMDN